MEVIFWPSSGGEFHTQRRRAPFEVNIFDPEGNLGFELGVYGAPESYLVDTEGTIRYKHTGYITSEDVERVIQEVEKWKR